MTNNVIKWEKPQEILVILAHPDDPEFFCGATIAKWTSEGHAVSYCLLTKGDKGVNDRFKSDDIHAVKKLREGEQKKAAAVLGVNKILFYDNPDGYLVPSLLLRRQVVRAIRIIKPDIVVSCDPTNYYIRDTYINHPDHRAAGQIVVDSVFPASQNPAFFPDLLIVEGLQPHNVKEVWLSLPTDANVVLDVTTTWPIKIKALHEHRSQIGDMEEFDQRMLSRRTEDSTAENPKFQELFRRIIFQR